MSSPMWTVPRLLLAALAVLWALPAHAGQLVRVGAAHFPPYTVRPESGADTGLLPQLVEALALLVAQGRNVHLKMINAEYPVGESAALIADVRKRVQELGLEQRVEINTGFLEDADSLTRLGDADLIVFPYQNTGESSSGAVRYGMACGRPVAVTPLSIFDDVRRATFALPGQSPSDLARGLGELIDAIAANAPHVEQVRTEAARWRDAHRYSRVGQRLLNMTLALHRAERSPLAAVPRQPDFTV